ncbi:hypothetical protein AB0873_15050 [Micromonospora sp. NPDC047707]
MSEDPEPTVVITPGVDEDPLQVSGEAVDERDVLGDAAALADPAAHQEVS